MNVLISPCFHEIMYDIATITVNYKMKDKIVSMLESLARDVQGAGLQIQSAVVDNASSDGIEQELAKRFPQVQCLANWKNFGFGAANNVALHRFDAKYYFLINPDVTFPENQKITQALFDFMEKYPKIGLVAPKLILENSSIQPSCLRRPGFWDQPFYRLGFQKKYRWVRKRVDRLLMADFDHNRILPVDWVTGAALFIRGDVLRQIGFFDERFFMYFEDCDLCQNFWEHGWPVYYKGDVFLFHRHERASAKISGLKSIFQNELTRVHLSSLIKYWFKWRSRKL